MSSSVFLESCSVPKTMSNTLDEQTDLGSSIADGGSAADSNLVVVYSKNGINFDRQGLENLIEEKTLSSISVIRLTSPTPSMEEEEAEAERIKEIVRRQEMGSDEEEFDDSEALSTDNERNSAEEAEDQESNVDEGTSSSEEDNTSDEEEADEGNETTASTRYKKKYSKKSRQKARAKSDRLEKHRSRRSDIKERPEIVGLTVEEFYPPEDAKEMAKEILKLAGVSTIKRTPDYEFQLFVIKNDHCYTPFTSPDQMKAKMAADKLEAEKSKTVVRKLQPQTYSSVKQFITKKKQQQVDAPSASKPTVAIIKKSVNVEHEKLESKIRIEAKITQKDKRSNIDNEGTDYIVEDDEDANTSASEQDQDFDDSDFSTTELSAESENDRDSDLDFDVYNRKGRKRKVQNIKTAKRNLPIKGPQLTINKQQHHDSESATTSDASAPRFTSNAPRSVSAKTLYTPVKFPAGAFVRKLLPTTESATKTLTPAQPLVIKKQILIEKTTNPSTQQTTLAAAVRRGPIVQVGASTARPTQLIGSAGKVPSSPQSVKEIVINKVIASPKGGFTDIGALLSQPDTPTTPTSSRSQQQQQQQKTTPSSKGFMPLGVETAAKNQLPSQISIQTHQSSSELAAEHDKQLDLIDSIVKDEMEKKSSIIEKAAGVNENIPQLVKMLESTEHALESKKSQQTSAFTTSNTVEDDIDITNAPLLETPEDEIPADLLQHVVDLIEDDKTLQEAVEKQVFGEDSNVRGSSIIKTPPPQLSSIFQSQSDKSKSAVQIAIEKASSTSTSTPHALPQLQTKSIIQATLFNEVVTTSTPTTATRASTSTTPKMSSISRKEPIQIIRGNGRVITLPPIEAPTTRAKRRALTQPLNTSLADSLQSTINESLDTSLQSNASFSTDSAGMMLSSIMNAEKKTTETLTAAARRRISKEGSAAVVSTKATKKAAAKKAISAKATAAVAIKHDEASESQEDDDDPKKLWCICRQPHNNRFMICCDACEDWFHGTCVSITKAMGLEMEQKGIDWTCPKCLKKIEEKKQRKITDMLETKKGPAVIAQHIATNQNIYTKVAMSETDSILELTPPTTITTPIQESLPKKPLIEIKKIQSGQFISLKNLEQKKLPVTVLTSAQKKQFLPMHSTTAPTKCSSSQAAPQTQPKRVIVVQKMAAQKSDSPNKGITLIKSPHHQQLKFHKIPIAGKTIPIAKEAEPVKEEPVEPTTPCIVCKKPARPNSIYCSDDCIRKHAQNALNAFTAKQPEIPVVSQYAKPGTEDKKKKAKGLFEDLLLMADRKPKVERVYVFERKSGRVLTGNNAPTTVNLKKWLQDNPTFEVVQPGSSQAIEIEKKQKPRSTLVPRSTYNLSPTHASVQENTQTSLKKTSLFQTQISTDIPVKDLPPLQSKSIRQIVDQTKSSPRPATPKQLTKYPQQVSLKAEKTQKTDSKDENKLKDKNAAKRQNSDSSIKKPVQTENSASSSDSEPIRLNVRRTLKEQLFLRFNELNSDGEKPSTEYIENFAKDTESEMYHFFNRDTGAKYKAKYRSLMFNIKDRKNHTLFQKICAKIINPKQFVRMTPEELASQELAQWRENETKHQLEMIKKSELDLLSCAKNYVLKTHKGEEVIEGKATDCVNLDMTIPVEDVVSVLNNSTLEEIEETATPTTTRRDFSYSDFDVSKDLSQSYQIETDLYSTVEEKTKPVKKETDRERERSHRSKDRHRDKSRTRKRSRSRSRSREKRHKSSSHKDDKRDREDRDREKERDRDKEHGRERDRSKDEHEKKSTEKKTLITTVHSPLTIKSTSSAAKDKPKDAAITKKETNTFKPLETFSLIDQILESTKTVEEAANLVIEKHKVESSSHTTSKISHSAATSSSASSAYLISQNSADSDQEPTSTVSIVSPTQDPYSNFCNDGASKTLWSGNINMIDVASFQIVVQPVIGNAVNLGKLLPAELDVVGRIGPETVWDYISKIKKSPNKEIVILRLLPGCESETAAYTILYKYLHKRNRLGVIKTSSSQIKDFYIFPLGAGTTLPTVLQPTERVEFYEDPYRPDILVGIVIRVIGKRLTNVAAPQPTSKNAKFQKNSKSSDTFTPPSSPKRKQRVVSNATKDVDIDIDAIIKAPITAKKTITAVMPTSTTVDDQDEPYSPGCSSDDDLPLLTVKATEFHKTAEEELKRKMDDLNRQIAAQEMEIAGLLNVEPSKYISSSGTGSSSGLNPSLASISIPSNLSQILASIKSKPEPPPPSVPVSHPSAAPPPPLIGSLHGSQRNDGDEEYNPEQAIDDSYIGDVQQTSKSSTSRLAQLSEAELLSMVPDDMLNPTASSLPPAIKKPRFDEPPPPGV